MSSKRRLPTLALPLLITATAAQAQYAGLGATPAATTIRAILAKPVDDQRVVLSGRVLQQVSSDKYLFSDGTGQIRIEMDSDELPAQTFDDKTEVEIIGKVEKEFLDSPEIDVKSVSVKSGRASAAAR